MMYLRCDCEIFVASIDIYGDLSVEGDGIPRWIRFSGNALYLYRGDEKVVVIIQAPDFPHKYNEQIG